MNAPDNYEFNTAHELNPLWWLIVFLLPMATLAAMHWAAFK